MMNKGKPEILHLYLFFDIFPNIVLVGKCPQRSMLSVNQYNHLGIVL